MKQVETKDGKKLHEQRRKMYDAVDKYKKSFLNASGDRIDSKYLERRNCPCCGSNDCREIFIKNGGCYVACVKCSMVYLNPVFKDKELYLYYKNNNEVQAEAHANESEFYRGIYKKGLGDILNVTSLRSVLDIGCSSGFFLDIAKENGSETYGIELNKNEREIAQSKGHRTWGFTVDKFEENLKFDAITLWDVFEHIKGGIDYLKILNNFLSDTGLVFLQIPNVNALAARVLQSKCNMFDGLEHVNLYNDKTIISVANSAGFEVVSISSIIDELGPTRNYLNYEDPYFGSFAPDEQLEFLAPDVIHKNLLGYKLQIIMKPS